MSGSAEGLIQHIGQSGVQRLLSIDELSHLLEKAAIDRASFPFILNRAYSENSFSIIASGRKEIPYHAVLSVLGSIVTENFQRGFGHTTTGGLYDRFIFGLYPTGFEYDFRPWEGTATDINPCAVTIHGDVWAAKDEWKKDNPALASRVTENAIRAAVICAAWHGQDTLRACHLEPARALAEYQARVRTVLRPNPGENTDAKCAFAIVEVLKNSRGALLRRDVYATIHAERFGPGAFDRAVKSLEFNGYLEQYGKRPKYLKPIREDEVSR